MVQPIRLGDELWDRHRASHRKVSDRVRDSWLLELRLACGPHRTTTTRALAHTSVRPAGISAQFDGADVIVSVRSARYQPVSRASVDVFWAAADQMDRVFAADGTCEVSEVTRADRSSFPCEIDETDPVTGRDGDARVAVTGLRRVPRGGAVAWAWTGRTGDTLGAGSDLYTLEVAEGADLGYATTALISTFSARKARFGSTVLYTIQLQDIVGNVQTGENGIDPAKWLLSVRIGAEDPEEQTLVSDSTGEAAFTISVADPNPGGADGDLTATYTLAALDNAPPIVDASGQSAATGTLTFSDEASSISPNSATVTIETRQYIHVLDGTASNSVTVTVRDQYGSPFPGAMVRLGSSGLSDVTLDGSAVLTTNSRGSRRFSYRYSGSGGETETLTAGFGTSSANEGSVATTVYWAADAGEADSGSVLAGDALRRQIVVDDSDGPVILVFDDNDRFDVQGANDSEPKAVRNIEIFERALAKYLAVSPNSDDRTGACLEWQDFRRERDTAVIRLWHTCP